MRLFADDDFQFGLRDRARRRPTGRPQTPARSLATAERIPDGDADGWIREWDGDRRRRLGRRRDGATRRAPGHGAGLLPARGDLLLDRALLRRQGDLLQLLARARDLAPSSRLLGARRRPLAGAGRAVYGSPTRAPTCAGYFFRAPDARTRRAAAAGDRQQRQRRRDLQRCGDTAARPRPNAGTTG